MKLLVLFNFCDTHLEVPLISMDMYHLELTLESYKFPIKSLEWYIINAGYDGNIALKKNVYP